MNVEGLFNQMAREIAALQGVRWSDIGDRGVTVVVVEHNMELVMNVADRVLVMDYGQHLFEGVPADVQKNAAVVSAYLGGELM